MATLWMTLQPLKPANVHSHESW